MLETAATIYVYQTYAFLFIVLVLLVLMVLSKINRKLFVYGILILIIGSMVGGLLSVLSKIN